MSDLRRDNNIKPRQFGEWNLEVSNCCGEESTTMTKRRLTTQIDLFGFGRDEVNVTLDEENKSVEISASSCRRSPKTERIFVSRALKKKLPLPEAFHHLTADSIRFSMAEKQNKLQLEILI